MLYRLFSSYKKLNAMYRVDFKFQKSDKSR